MPDKSLPSPVKFDWDKYNQDKNFIKHQVNYKECEHIFFNEPIKILADKKHSNQEKRLLALGVTNENKKLSIIFTLRKNKIRVISARPMSKEERRYYVQKKA